MSMEGIGNVAFRQRRGGDALYAGEATNGLPLAVAARALRPRVLDEEHGVQRCNLRLCQDFFVGLYE